MFRAGMFPEERTGAEVRQLGHARQDSDNRNGPPSFAPTGKWRQNSGTLFSCMCSTAEHNRSTHTGQIANAAADYSAAADDNIQELSDLARKVY